MCHKHQGCCFQSVGEGELKNKNDRCMKNFMNLSPKINEWVKNTHFSTPTYRKTPAESTFVQPGQERSALSPLAAVFVQPGYVEVQLVAAGERGKHGAAR